VFSDDFESGITNWLAIPGAKGLVADGLANHTAGGTASAAGLAGSQRSYHPLDKKVRGRLRLTFWMYDDGDGKSAYGDIRGYSGEAGFAHYVTKFRAAFRQSLGIGYRTTADPAAQALGGDKLDPTRYQAYVFRGTNRGWFNLDAAGVPMRSRGWHKFEIQRRNNQSSVDFYVDGVLGKSIRGVKAADIDTITIASWANDAVLGTTNVARFDDLKLESWPQSFDSKTVTSQGPFSDLTKLREVGTNGEVAGITAVTANQVVGSAQQKAIGQWSTEGNAVNASGWRGYLEYAISAPADDVYRLEIEGRERNARAPSVDLPLKVAIDGELLGTFNLSYDGSVNGFVHALTPFIRSGSHTVGISWENPKINRYLRLEAIRLQSLPSTQSTRAGTKLWVAKRLAAECGIDFAPAANFVSPVCIEGRGQYLSMMSINAGVGEALSPVAVSPGAGNRWYANVPLSPEQRTRIEVSYQNGGVHETNEIEWQVTDLLEAQDMLIRKGDSLLLTAAPAGATDGTVQIAIAGSEAINTDASHPIVYKFDQAGTFIVSGQFVPTRARRTINVRVVDATLDPVVAVFKTKPHWDCTNLPPEVVVQADPRIGFRRLLPEERAKIKGAAPISADENARSFRIGNVTPEPRYVLARLGKKGPVLASSMIQGVEFLAPPSSPLSRLPDIDEKTQVYEAEYHLTPIIPNLSIAFHIDTGGVTFEDGKIQRMVSASDFDALGTVRFRFLRSPSANGTLCNKAKIYYDGVLIGKP
jgi:hypothetical protein